MILGSGVYHISEAARYMGMAANTLRSWFKPRSDGRGRGPIFQSDYDPVDGDYAISFLNLMDARFAGLFKRHGVSARIIRDTHQQLQKELKTPYPFAHATLGTDGRRIIREVVTTIGEPELIDVLSRQHFFGEMRDGLEQVTYNAHTHLADTWGIAPGIVIDPRVSFGKPVIEFSGTTTHVIFRQYRANHQNASLVAKLFSLTEEDVLNAVRFEASLN